MGICDFRNSSGEYVNTNEVQNVASNIRQINADMQNSKENLNQQLINEINDYWRSSGGLGAQYQLEVINRMFNESSNASDNLVNYLQSCVVDGYEILEEHNESLGDQFL